VTVCYCTKEECQALAAKISLLEGRLANLEARFNTHTRQPIPDAHRYTPPKEPKGDWCTKEECKEIYGIATTALGVANRVDADLRSHKTKDIPDAHKYKPKVNVSMSGSTSGNSIKVFTRVDVDGSSGNDSVVLTLTPNVTVEFSLAASADGTLKGFSKVCLWGICASASSRVKLPINTPTPPPIVVLPPISIRPPTINLPRVPIPSLPRIPIPTVPTPTLPRGGVAPTAESQKISCNLTGIFNPSSCTLTLTLTVNSCSKTISIKMNCKDYTAILNRIEQKLGSPLPIYRGSYRDPSEEGEWYGYERDITSQPSSIGSALGILSAQVEDMHKDVVKGIEGKSTLPELPLPKVCQVNPTTGEKEIVQASLQQMGFGAVIPWLGREVVRDFLTGKLLDYIFDFITKGSESTQETVCSLDTSCQVLLPDPSTPLNTVGSYLLFTWVLEEDPRPSTYQTTGQLRNPIEELKTISSGQWGTYFQSIYKIIGLQYSTYWSEESTKEPLVKGWYLNEEEAVRYFTSIRTLTADTPTPNNNPRYSKVTNANTRIANIGKKLILRKVCYGTYGTGSDDRVAFKAIHSWKNPYI
jgi:hypothetical protein